jgi:hypothetical protein
VSSCLRQGRSYDPSVKSSGAQREAEVVVPLVGVQHDALGGKAPALVMRAEGTGQGMVPSAGPNHRAGQPSSEQVRRLERALSAAAERSMRRRRQVSKAIAVVTRCGRLRGRSPRSRACRTERPKSIGKMREDRMSGLKGVREDGSPLCDTAPLTYQGQREGSILVVQHS